MTQHPLRFFFLKRHSTPSLWHNIRFVSSFWYVTVRRHYNTTSALFLLSDTSQFAVTLIPNWRRLLFLIRYSTPPLWYKIGVVSSCWNVTVQRHFDTTSSSFLLADTSQYAVTMTQRRGRFFCLIRHSTASLWYNVLVVSSCWYVTVRRHYDTDRKSIV